MQDNKNDWPGLNNDIYWTDPSLWQTTTFQPAGETQIFSVSKFYIFFLIIFSKQKVLFHQCVTPCDLNHSETITPVTGDLGKRGSNINTHTHTSSTAPQGRTFHLQFKRNSVGGTSASGVSSPGRAWKSHRQEQRGQSDGTTSVSTHTPTHTFVPVQRRRRRLVLLVSWPVVHHLPQCAHLCTKPPKAQSHFEATGLKWTVRASPVPTWRWAACLLLGTTSASPQRPESDVGLSLQSLSVEEWTNSAQEHHVTRGLPPEDVP